MSALRLNGAVRDMRWRERVAVVGAVERVAARAARVAVAAWALPGRAYVVEHPSRVAHLDPIGAVELAPVVAAPPGVVEQDHHRLRVDRPGLEWIRSVALDFSAHSLDITGISDPPFLRSPYADPRKTRNATIHAGAQNRSGIQSTRLAAPKTRYLRTINAAEARESTPASDDGLTP